MVSIALNFTSQHVATFSSCSASHSICHNMECVCIYIYSYFKLQVGTKFKSQP